MVTLSTANTDAGNFSINIRNRLFTYKIKHTSAPDTLYHSYQARSRPNRPSSSRSANFAPDLAHSGAKIAPKLPQLGSSAPRRFSFFFHLPSLSFTSSSSSARRARLRLHIVARIRRRETTRGPIGRWAFTRPVAEICRGGKNKRTWCWRLQGRHALAAENGRAD